MKSATDLYNEAKARVNEIDAQQALTLHARGDVVFVDVRDENEVNLGKIPGAMHLSRGRLESKVEAAIPREAEVVLYCASGNRSALAAESLKEMGYQHVSSISTGFRGWVEAGGEIEE
jgi:rhodanese-related sulfurtransferase